ncbi:hypothetical protein ACFRMN_22105 [Streptomyces sp. NPDC056835]|uniref:hypothetical protein n=1 Tax=Streptomyces sp. NPDC056835 TaxID=3345956 RepID=UPI0036BFC88B
MGDNASQRPALDVTDTAEALGRYHARGVMFAGRGLVMLAGSGIIGLIAAGLGLDSVVSLVPNLVGLSLATLGLGLLARRLSGRMRRHLAAAPWTVCVAVSIPRGWRAATVVLRDPATGELWPLTVWAIWGLNQPVVHRPPGGVLWWCGDPRTGGVIALPGGTGLCWTRAVRGSGARRSAVQRAERAGLLEQPMPPMPHTSDEPHTSDAPDAPRWAAMSKAAPRRRRGVFRWILLVGVALLGLGIAGSTAASKDPQIDLTVISQQPDGTCEVRWSDPWSGARHEGPFRCDPDRDPLLEDWWTGWVVSYGPWKGDLYDSDWRGTPANDVNDALLLAGAALTLTGLVGLVRGAVKRVYRPEPADRRPEPTDRRPEPTG